MVVATVIATAEWLHAPSTPWAACAAGAALVAAGLCVAQRRVLPVVLGGLVLLLSAELAYSAWHLKQIADDWPAQREERITAYGARVGGELRSSLRSATRLADRGVAAAQLSQEHAFEALARAVPASGAEVGVAILDSTGAPGPGPGGTGWLRQRRATRSMPAPVDITSFWRRAATRPAGWSSRAC